MLYVHKYITVFWAGQVGAKINWPVAWTVHNSLIFIRHGRRARSRFLFHPVQKKGTYIYKIYSIYFTSATKSRQLEDEEYSLMSLCFLSVLFCSALLQFLNIRNIFAGVFHYSKKNYTTNFGIAII
jgi:hypothetical protein